MTGGRKALLIATDSYSDPQFSRLHASAADVAGLYAVLSDPAIGGYVATQLLNVPEPGATRAVDDFFKDASLEDQLMLYVSGHGVKDEDGQLYLATADSRHDRLASTSVSARFLRDQMRRSRCRRIVVLLDCCYSGAFPSGLRHKGEEQVDVLSQLSGRGYAVITSSSALEYSYETVGEIAGTPQPAAPSLFTGIVIDGLRTGEADLDGDGLIDIDELYSYTYDRVIAAVPGQTPQKKSDLGGPLYIARSARNRQPHVVTPPRPSPPAPVGPGGTQAHPVASADKATMPAPATLPEPADPAGTAQAARRPASVPVMRSDQMPVPAAGTSPDPIILGGGGETALPRMRFHGASVVFGMMVLFGALTLFGAEVEFLQRDASAGFLMLAGAGMELGFGLLFLSGIKPDMFSFGQEALKIRRMWRNNITDLSIRWNSVERITVERKPQDTEFVYSIVARFRPGREPSPALLRKFGGRRRLDGSYVVYRSGRWHCNGMPVSRLNEVFPVYAGHWYVDKTSNSSGR